MRVPICNVTLRKLLQTVQNSSGMAERPRGKAITRETQGSARHSLVGTVTPKVRADCEAWSALQSYSNPMSSLGSVSNFPKACTHFVVISVAFIRGRILGKPGLKDASLSTKH